MKTITIIIARGGSKRLPRKNTKFFCGKPLIAWSIIQSRACALIDETYVTTDDDQIAEIATEYGAKVLMREDARESLDETVGTIPLVSAVKRIMKEREFDSVLSLLTTGPLRRINDFKRLIQKFDIMRGYKIKNDQQYFRTDSLSMYAPMKDVFIYKRIDHEKCLATVMDKTFSYLALCGGDGISSKESVLKHKISWDDKKTWHDPVTFELSREPNYYILGKWWQTFEIDFQSDFDICEYFFDKYLLADWENVYIKGIKK